MGATRGCALTGNIADLASLASSCCPAFGCGAPAFGSPSGMTCGATPAALYSLRGWYATARCLKDRVSGYSEEGDEKSRKWEPR